MEELKIVTLLREGSLYLGVLTAIIATITFHKYKNSFLKYILYFLWYVAINEFIGLIVKTYSEDRHNSIVYNIYGIVSLVFFLSIYRHFIQKKKFKKYISFFIVSCVVLYIVSAFFIDYMKNILTIAYLYGSIALAISIVFYFIETLNSERILVISKDILFWISIGLFIFQMGIIPFMIIREYYIEFVLLELNIILLLYYVLIYVLNICYITGFIWGQKLLNE
ncbi:hypothetical protein [Kordia sp.]|uniref:hypothetical protein n=1 Tax=Kordia sp. TaxID=1965332 RepID=UPI0025C15EFB|nr:hypothetical protein [Kordia sp.]MCH2195051.1 hypothetical protein [Kordia sp.]